MPRLPTGGLGGTIYVYPSIDSTNLQAAALARQGAAHGTVVIAEAQTEGRGRAGSHWESRPGSSIALSVRLVCPDLSGGKLAGLRALAVAQALEGFGLLPRKSSGPTTSCWVAGRSQRLARSGVLGEPELVRGVGDWRERRERLDAFESSVDFPATSA